MDLPNFPKSTAKYVCQIGTVLLLIVGYCTILHAQAAAALKPFMPNLYILSIGVSTYIPPVATNPTAASDAADVYSAFKKQEGILFGKVVSINPWTDVSTSPASDTAHPGPLVDYDATRQNIELSLLKIGQLKDVRPIDLLVVCINGHGVSFAPNGQRSQFYFLPADSDSQLGVDSWALRWDDLESRISSVNCNRIVIMDTSNAGDISEASDQSGPGQLPTQSDATAPVLTLCSCGARENNLDISDGKSSLYAFWLCKALSGSAPANKEGVITARTLSCYVRQHVIADSNGLQNPPLLSDGSELGDIPLAKVSH